KYSRGPATINPSPQRPAHALDSRAGGAMKAYLVGILVALAAFSAFAGGESVESGKIYVSDDGVEVAVVTLKGAPKALVRVTGSGTELDGKARLHDIVDN